MFSRNMATVTKKDATGGVRNGNAANGGIIIVTGKNPATATTIEPERAPGPEMTAVDYCRRIVTTGFATQLAV